MIWHTFYVEAQNLGKLVGELNGYDEMGGWRIKRIDPLGKRQYLIIATRKYSYPCIENRLEEKYLARKK